MRLTYDPALDLLSMRLRSGKIARSEDIDDGVMFLYDAAGRVLGMTFADARKRMTVEELTTVTYENISSRLRGSLACRRLRSEVTHVRTLRLHLQR